MNDLATSLKSQGENQQRVSSNQLLSGLTSFTLKSGHGKQKGERKTTRMAALLHPLGENVSVCSGSEGRFLCKEEKAMQWDQRQTRLSGCDKNQEKYSAQKNSPAPTLEDG